jgi:hypothetical protein
MHNIFQFREVNEVSDSTVVIMAIESKTGRVKCNAFSVWYHAGSKGTNVFLELGAKSLCQVSVACFPLVVAFLND